MATFKYKMVGDTVDREVEVDNAAIKGAFLVLKKDNVLEFLPAHTVVGAVLVYDNEDVERTSV